MAATVSFCIPVYNCAEFLASALDSILSQVGKSSEVVVFDGGSTDATPSLMAGYVARFDNVRYHRAEERGGIDADLASCVQRATGDYCWLFSGDDVLRQGAVARVLEALESNRDVYVCKHALCDFRMTFLRDYPVLEPDVAFDSAMDEPAARVRWFARARNTEAFFSFISGLVVRRAAWESGRLVPEFAGSCWAHVARLFELMPKGLTVAYLGEAVLLDQRGDNDSFRARGLVRRYALAIDGYHALAARYFGEASPEAFHVRRVIRNEFELKMFLSAKLGAVRAANEEDLRLLDALVAKTYRDPGTINACKRLLYRAMPPWGIALAIRVWWLFHTPRARREA